MKKIYITGIAGLVGSNLAKRLIGKGYYIKGCDSLIGGYESNIPVDSRYCEWDNLDILDNESLAQSMQGCEAVIHAAALAYEGLSVFSPKLVMENIHIGTVSVASAMIQNNIKKLIHCSSMARYGAQTAPFTEDLPLKPEDPYGLAKTQAEISLKMLSDIHGFKYYIAVPHNIIGVGQRYDDPFRNVIAIFINRLLQSKPIFIYGDGQQKRSISYIQDCVNPIIQLLETNEFPNGEVFNIGPDDNEMTIKELGYLVAHHCNIYPSVEYLPGRPREVKYAWCSSSKAKKYLNYKTQTKLNDGLKEMINWVKTRGVLPFNYSLPIEIINDSTPKTWTQKLI